MWRSRLLARCHPHPTPSEPKPPPLGTLFIVAPLLRRGQLQQRQRARPECEYSGRGEGTAHAWPCLAMPSPKTQIQFQTNKTERKKSRTEGDPIDQSINPSSSFSFWWGALARPRLAFLCRRGGPGRALRLHCCVGVFFLLVAIFCCCCCDCCLPRLTRLSSPLFALPSPCPRVASASSLLLPYGDRLSSCVASHVK